MRIHAQEHKSPNMIQDKPTIKCTFSILTPNNKSCNIVSNPRPCKCHKYYQVNRFPQYKLSTCLSRYPCNHRVNSNTAVTINPYPCNVYNARMSISLPWRLFNPQILKLCNSSNTRYVTHSSMSYILSPEFHRADAG